MTPPLATVVITTRNRRTLLTETVESVAKQHGLTWEMVIVDDASDDGTPSYLRDLAADPRIKIITHTIRQERSRSRNKGLAVATGKTVMFLDDDDVLLPGALKRLFDAVDSDPQAVASCGARIDWRASRGARGRTKDSHTWFRTTRDILPELVFGWSAVSGQNLFLTEAARRTPGFRVDLNATEDRLFWMEVARQGPVALIPHSVMLYRLHENQQRPANLQSLRNRVYRLGMHMARGDERRRLIRARTTSRRIGMAEAALQQRRYIRALGLTAGALWICPARTATSPLIFPWVVRRLARAVRQGLQDLARKVSAVRSQRIDVAG